MYLVEWDFGQVLLVKLWKLEVFYKTSNPICVLELILDCPQKEMANWLTLFSNLRDVLLRKNAFENFELYSTVAAFKWNMQQRNGNW